MIDDLAAAIAWAFRRLRLPLAAYYAVTVAIPLANGAAQSGAAFVRHTQAILIVPPVIVVLVATVCMITSRVIVVVRRVLRVCLS